MGDNSVWFWFAFPELSDDEHLFMWLLAIIMSSLGWCLSRSLLFLNWIVWSFCCCWFWVMWVHFILDISPLLYLWFANIPSHSVACSLSVSFAVQLLSLSFDYFCFCCSCLWSQIQKYIPKSDVKELTIYGVFFFSRSLMVSGLTFKSLMNFELIFVYGVRWWSNFILLHMAVQFSQYHLLRTLSFPNCTLLSPLL